VEKEKLTWHRFIRNLCTIYTLYIPMVCPPNKQEGIYIPSEIAQSIQFEGIYRLGISNSTVLFLEIKKTKKDPILYRPWPIVFFPFCVFDMNTAVSLHSSKERTKRLVPLEAVQ